MAQVANAFRRHGRVGEYLPKASTDIASGDPLMLVPETGRVEPLTKTREGQYDFIGIADDKWDSTVAVQLFGAGSTEYATPSSVRIKVHHDGVFDLAISDTSGFAGQTVFLSTATSGAYVFTITQPTTDETAVIVGELEQDFSGATANDVQKVRIHAKAGSLQNAMEYYLKNHVVHGLTVAFDCTSLVSYSSGAAYVDGAYYCIPYSSAALAIPCASSTGRRTVLYVINSSGAAAIVDSGTNTWTGNPATATALQKSAYWPKTSYLIFGVGYLGSASSDLNAGAVATVRRSLTDIAFKRYISN